MLFYSHSRINRCSYLDSLVVRFPTDGTNFAGSFSHNESSNSGNLDITAELSSVNLDVNRSLTAEDGKQFVAIKLPAGAPPRTPSFST